MAGGKLAQQKVAIAIRRNHVLKLRLQGGDWREIAETLRDTLDSDQAVPGVTEKYSYVHAYQDATAEMKRLTAENKELSQFELDVQLEQLRELWAKFYPMALERGDYLAFDRCMTIQERRAKLFNLDSPHKIALTDPTGQKEYGAGLTNDERIAILRELFSHPATPQAQASPGDADPSEPGGV